MIKSKFNYCPLVWMYCSRQSNNLINRVHEKGLRLTYRNKTNKEFQQILRGKNEPTIHQKNLEVLMTEVYKIVNGIAPPIMNSLFNFRTNIHNIRNFQELRKRKLKYGIEQWRIESKRMTYLQSEYKNAKSLEELKPKTKNWKCDFCPCRLCKNYVQHFLEPFFR